MALCTEILQKTKFLEQALGWTASPTHVYRGGMLEAAVTEQAVGTVFELQVWEGGMLPYTYERRSAWPPHCTAVPENLQKLSKFLDAVLEK